MAAQRDADVIIVGTGQAAVPLAARLAAAGKRVVVFERAKPGGTCVNVGCTPTKTLVASARAAHVARTHQLSLNLLYYWRRVYRDIAAKRRTTRYLHRRPLLVEEVGGVG